MFSNVFNKAVDIPYMLCVAEKKFVQGDKTMELMAEARTDQQRFTVAVVVLMEVEEPLRFFGMSEPEAGMVQGYHGLVQTFLNQLPPCS